jgi:Ca-activated chloride channel family protein
LNYSFRKDKKELRRIQFTILSFLVLFCASLRAQSTEALIRRGNRFYNKQDYDESLTNYEKALKKTPGNPDAHFNEGDALYRKNDYEKAAGSYDDVLQSKADENTRQGAYYNKGVAMIRQKKIDESIDAWKNALRLNPEDELARDNLVKALMEKKKQEQKEQKEKKNQPDKKQQENKQNQEDKRPKPQQSKLSKQQVEQYLKSLEQREKDVQDKMNQNKSHSLSQPEKDW